MFKQAMPWLSIALLAMMFVVPGGAAQSPATKQPPAAKAKQAPAANVRSAPASSAKAHTPVASAAQSARQNTLRSAAVRRGARPQTPRPVRTPVQYQPTSERYREIQLALAGKGYFKGAPDGVWGADSVDALKRFQKDQNLTDDGKLSSLSLIAMGLGPQRATPPPPPAEPNPSAAANPQQMPTPR